MRPRCHRGLRHLGKPFKISLTAGVSMRPRCHRGLRLEVGLHFECDALSFNEAPVSPGFATPPESSTGRCRWFQ